MGQDESAFHQGGSTTVIDDPEIGKTAGIDEQSRAEQLDYRFPMEYKT